ncbi:MAG: hypothetical protein JWP63_6077 [Candidatus Solibacter sp.]|jgi:hypothetical protein|nr:hypothetical protein [Candidatus Solibacter sp.]
MKGEILMSNKIAFNPQDRFVVTLGGRIVVTTQDGSVFGHDLSGHHAGDAFQFSGSRAAFNPQDRFVVTMGNRLMVTTQNGAVFGHDVTGIEIGQPFQFTGARAAFNPQDRFVTTIGNKLIVTTQNGDVFGHEITGRDIGPPFKFTGSRMAFNPQDRFVVTAGNTLIVTTQNGDVFGADVSGHGIGPIFKFGGSRMAFNPQDRFVVTNGNTMIVTTRNGDAFGADIAGRNIGPIFQLNPSDVLSFDAIDGDGTTQLKSGLPLGGSAHLVVTESGAFSFSSHAHDSGFDNIDYTLGAVLMTPSGVAFTFGSQGSVEGTVAGLPFGKPKRDDDHTASGANPALKTEFERLRGATLVAQLAGTDTLTAGLKGLLGEALKSAAQKFGLSAATAVIALL